MKFLTLFLLSLMLINCGGDSGSNESVPSSHYLSYNETATEVTGQIIFDMGTIPSGHIIMLSNFIPSIQGCTIDLLNSTLDPELLRFSPLTTKNSATLNVMLTGACSTQELILKADHQDSSLLSGKIITKTKEVEYRLSIKSLSSLSNNTPYLNSSTLYITKNSQNETVVVSVFDELNRPTQEGSVSVIYPDIIANGIDVGSFSQTSVAVVTGEARFSYTAPQNLQTLAQNSIEQVQFKFYYNDDIAKSTSLTVDFNITEEDQYIPKGYSISFTPQNNLYKMSLEETKSFSVSVIDDEGNLVTDANIIDLNVTLGNSFVADLIDSEGNTSTEFNFSNKNNITLTLKSKTKSGLIPIAITSSFKGVNYGLQNELTYLNETFNIIVESGPPTAISISYVGTDQDEERAKFIEKFAVSVTDKYFNPVNTNPQVSVGSIVGYAKFTDDNLSANTDNRIYVDTGTLATLNKNTLNINKDYLVNSTIDLDNDILVTYGNAYTYPASGAWEIEDFNISSITLSEGQYDGNKTENLGFTIGRNHRQDACDFGVEWLGQAKMQNDATTIDDTGTAIIELSYDYYLVGKDIVVYINIIGKDNVLNREVKIGEASKHTLRGHGIEFGGDGTVQAPFNDSNESNSKVFLWIKDTYRPYENARFSIAKIETTGACLKTDSKKYDYSHRDSCVPRNGQSNIQLNYQTDCNSSYTNCEVCNITLFEPRITPEF